jgi:hypothetical protein
MSLKKTIARGASVCAVVALLASHTVLLWPQTAMAQTQPASTAATPTATGKGEPALAEPTSCFDYYHFGGVTANIQAANASVLSGTKANFTAIVHNTNKYPIVDGAVYVKVFKKRQGNIQRNGYDVVDQFFVKDEISLPAGATQNYPFTWTIPSVASAGGYQIASYFVSAGKFNLLGLSFTDDIVGNTADFYVGGDADAAIGFNKDSAKVNGQPYGFAAFTPKVDEKAPVNITFDLVNPTKEKAPVNVSYTLYNWDSLQKSNIISTSGDSIALNAGETRHLSYTITDAAHPVYYLVVKADYKDSHSILNIRVTRDEVNVPRLNFVGVDTYPMTEGQPITAFACLHNMGTASDIDNGELVVKVKDATDKVLHSFLYRGNITGAVMGQKSTFTLPDTTSEFTVDATLSYKGKVVDTASMHYTCTVLGGNTCEKNNVVTTTYETYFYAGVGLGALIIVIIAVLLIKSAIAPKTALMSAAAILFFGVAGYGGLPLRVESDTTAAPTLATFPNQQVFTGTFSPNITVYAHEDLGMQARRVICDDTEGTLQSGPLEIQADKFRCVWKKNMFGPFIYDVSVPTGFQALNSVNLSVAYGAEIRDVTNPNLVPSPTLVSTPNTVVNVGDIITFQAVPYTNQQISWFATGNSVDSPYGYWTTKTDCSNDDKYGSESFGGTGTLTPQPSMDSSLQYSSVTNQKAGQTIFDFFFPLTVQKPTVTVNQRGTATLLPIGATTFKVASAGTVIADVVFGATTAKGTVQYKKSGATRCFTYDASNRSAADKAAFDSATTFAIPAQTITLQLTATGTPVINLPPTTPTLTVTNDQCTKSTQSITMTSTDPDAGDKMTYEIGVLSPSGNRATTTLPGGGVYVNSGTPQTLSRIFGEVGTYTITVMTRDNHSNHSAASIVTIPVHDCIDLIVGCSSNKTSVAKGFTVSFTGTANGVGGYRYWFYDPYTPPTPTWRNIGFTNATSVSQGINFATTGSYGLIQYKVQDSSLPTPQVVYATCPTITVTNTTITPTSTTLTSACQVNNQSTPITVRPGDTVIYKNLGFGGTSPYRYYFNTPLTQFTGTTTNTLPVTFPTIGSYAYSTTIVDNAQPNQNSSATCPTVTVANQADPVWVTCSVSKPIIATGDSVDYTVTAHDGVGPFNYTLTPSSGGPLTQGPLAASSAVWNNQTFPANGDYTYTVGIQDSRGDVDYGVCPKVEVRPGNNANDGNPSLIGNVSCTTSPSPATVPPYNIVTLIGSVSGGVAPYTYEFYDSWMPSSANRIFISQTQNATNISKPVGTYDYLVKITDKNGSTMSGRCPLVKVQTAPIPAGLTVDLYIKDELSKKSLLVGPDNHEISLPVGRNYTLYWDTLNYTSCRSTNFTHTSSGYEPSSRTMTSSSVTFSLSCTNPPAQQSDWITITASNRSIGEF